MFARLELPSLALREKFFRWIARIVRVPQLQFDPHCSFIPRKTKSEPSREIFSEGLYLRSGIRYAAFEFRVSHRMTSTTGNPC
jgi:hypothetical protein